jgi:hypothetical protein
MQEVLLDLSSDGLKLAQVPLLHQLFQADIYLEAGSRSLSGQLKKNGGSSYQTVVTPNVYALSVLLFQQQFKLVRPHRCEGLQLVQFSSSMEETHGASPIIEWIGSPSVSSAYNAVRIENTIYKV